MWVRRCDAAYPTRGRAARRLLQNRDDFAPMAPKRRFERRIRCVLRAASGCKEYESRAGWRVAHNCRCRGRVGNLSCRCAPELDVFSITGHNSHHAGSRPTQGGTGVVPRCSGGKRLHSDCRREGQRPAGRRPCRRIVALGTHAIEGLRPDGPQGLINPDLDSADVIVVIVWNRIAFGTAEALAEALLRWRNGHAPTLLTYFSEEPSVLATEAECLERIEFSRHAPFSMATSP